MANAKGHEIGNGKISDIPEVSKQMEESWWALETARGSITILSSSVGDVV